jgi:hypothetical protein
VSKLFVQPLTRLLREVLEEVLRNGQWQGSREDAIALGIMILARTPGPERHDVIARDGRLYFCGATPHQERTAEALRLLGWLPPVPGEAEQAWCFIMGGARG